MSLDSLVDHLQQHGRYHKGRGITSVIQSHAQITASYITDLYDIITVMCKNIVQARWTILLSTSYWDKRSTAAARLCHAFDELNQRCQENKLLIDVYIAVDLGDFRHAIGFTSITLTQYDISRTLSLPVQNWSHLCFHVKSLHRSLFGTMHAKYLIIDDQVLLLSSNNVQDRPNLEMAVEFQGRIVEDFIDHFWSAWGKRRQTSLYSASLTPSRHPPFVPIVHVHRHASGGAPRRLHTPQNVAWQWMFANAQKSIFIVTPTLNARHAIKSILDCLKRQITVVIVLTLGFNDSKESLPFQGGTNLQSAKKLYGKAVQFGVTDFLRLYWYVPRGGTYAVPKKGVHCHIKYMSMDGQFAMFGNGNMDTQSWYHSHEANVLVCSPTHVQEWDAVLTNAIALTRDCQFPYSQSLLPPDPGFEHYAY